MDFSKYQSDAAETNELPPSGPRGAVAPMLGLASETGSILNVYKQYLRRNINLELNADYLAEELGDLLWYLAAVATAFDLRLEDIAASNLRRTHDYYMPDGRRDEELARFEVLDREFPARERFPRHMVFRFDEEPGEGHPIALVQIVAAEPNPFPDGALVDDDGKRVGFTLGADLGDALADNSRRSDGYRFHDAIHLAFCAVLGWSPNTRSMLRLKRKSVPDIDNSEDSARAIFAEEGIAAMLAKLSLRRMGFQTETSIDMETIDVARAVVADLECAGTPAWLWRRAICQAFQAMRALQRHGGGYLVVDLDARRLQFRLDIDEAEVDPTQSSVDVDRLIDAIVRLHSAKDAAYLDAWKRRGEVLGVIANIARKVDRLENGIAGAPSTPDESQLDTVVDLFVYVVKYTAFLADLSSEIDEQLFGTDLSGRGHRSDGSEYVNMLIRGYAPVPLVNHRADEIGLRVVRHFNEFADSVVDSSLAVDERYRQASELASEAWQLLLTYAERYPAELRVLLDQEG